MQRWVRLITRPTAVGLSHVCRAFCWLVLDHGPFSIIVFGIECNRRLQMPCSDMPDMLQMSAGFLPACLFLDLTADEDSVGATSPSTSCLARQALVEHLYQY